LFRVVDIDLVHISDEPPTEPRTPRMRCKYIANELDRLYRSQLDCSDFLSMASE